MRYLIPKAAYRSIPPSLQPLIQFGQTVFNLMLADIGRIWTAREVLATIKSPHFAPGYGYRYSNTHYLLAGMIIEAATGTTWLQKMRQVILDPLAMDSTFCGIFEPGNGPVAAEYYMNIPIVYSPMTSEYTQVNSAGITIAIRQENEDFLNISIADDGIGREKAAKLKSKSATHKSHGQKLPPNGLK